MQKNWNIRNKLWNTSTAIRWTCLIKIVTYYLSQEQLCWPDLKLKNCARKGYKAKSRKYKGVFEVKSRVRTWQLRGIGLNNWSISKSQNGGRNQVSGRVSVPCGHATPVANAPWKPPAIRWRSKSVSRSWNWWKVWLVRKSLYNRCQCFGRVAVYDITWSALVHDGVISQSRKCVHSVKVTCL